MLFLILVLGAIFLRWSSDPVISFAGGGGGGISWKQEPVRIIMNCYLYGLFSRSQSALSLALPTGSCSIRAASEILFSVRFLNYLKPSLHFEVWRMSLKPVLRIRDVYPGSDILHPGSWIPDPNFLHSGSASKNLSILTQKNFLKLSEIWFRLFIPDPYPDLSPIARIQRSKRHRIPDPQYTA